MTGRRGSGVGMEVVEEGDNNTYFYTVTTRMTPPLNWAAMRAILMFHSLWRTKSQDSIHRPQLLKRKDSRSWFEPRSLSIPAWRLTARPNRLTLKLWLVRVTLCACWSLKVWLVHVTLCTHSFTHLPPQRQQYLCMQSVRTSDEEMKQTNEQNKTQTSIEIDDKGRYSTIRWHLPL